MITTDFQSFFIDQMKQINGRLGSLEKDVQEIKQKLTNKSFENTVNIAMQDLQEKLYELNALIKSQRNYDYKVQIYGWLQCYKIVIKLCLLYVYLINIGTNSSHF